MGLVPKETHKTPLERATKGDFIIAVIDGQAFLIYGDAQQHASHLLGRNEHIPFLAWHDTQTEIASHILPRYRAFVLETLDQINAVRSSAGHEFGGQIKAIGTFPKAPSSGAKERATEEMIARATEVLGNREDGMRWLGTPVRGLDFATPISLLGTPEGIERVSDILGQIEHGVW